MRRQMSSIFGRDFWNFLVIGVTKWKMSQEAIDDRNRKCQNYPELCKDEAWLIKEVSNQLEEKFQQNRTFAFAFMDSYSQSIPDIDDQVQQENWIRETGKLWQQATSKNETFEFLTIDDIIEENFKCKQENDQLRDIIDNQLYNINQTLGLHDSEIVKNKETFTALSSNISQNADEIKSIASDVRENTFDYHCSYKSQFAGTGTITYDREYFGMSSQDMVGHGMDIETGEYTAGHGGVYQISWSISSWDDIYILLITYRVYRVYKNSMQIPATALSLHISGHNVYETSSRSIFLRLDQFDKLYLHCEPYENQQAIKVIKT